MKTITVKKRGKTRVVVAPLCGTERREYRRVAGWLRFQVAAHFNRPESIVYGYGRSALDMALLHRGYQYTLCMDLENFYGHVTQEKVLAGCDFLQFEQTKNGILGCTQPLFINNVVQGTEEFAAAGLPTSPALANLAFAPCDEKLKQSIGCFSEAVVTRYVDDIIVSFNDLSLLDMIKASVELAVVGNQFVINHKKTKLHKAKAGRRIIVGLAVDDEVHIPRRVRRRLRVKLHQGDVEGFFSLRQYCQMKPGISKDPKEVMKHFFPEFMATEEGGESCGNDASQSSVGPVEPSEH